MSPCGDGAGGNADGVGAGRGGERVAHVVDTGNRQRRVGLARGRTQANGARQPLELVAPGDRGAMVQAELHRAALAGAAAKESGLAVVGVDDRDAVGGQRLVKRRVLRRDFLDRVHEFEVLALRVVDQGHRRSRNTGEIGDFALVVHAELDRAPAVQMPQSEQREGQADLVVEIAARGQHGGLVCDVSAKIAASISLTVVLPFDPAIPTSAGAKRARQ